MITDTKVKKKDHCLTTNGRYRFTLCRRDTSEHLESEFRLGTLSLICQSLTSVMS